VKHEHLLDRFHKDICQWKPINNPAAWVSATILSSKFPSIQGVGSVGGGTSHYPRIVDRIKRNIPMMLLVVSMLSISYTTLYFIYYTFIQISFSDSLNSIVLITCHHFKFWQAGSALLLHLLFLPAPGEEDDLSKTRIPMTISAGYQTVTMIIARIIQNSMMSLFGHHPGKQWASGHQMIPSHQHLENKLR